MPNYGDPKYWEERYKAQSEATFDWLEDYVTLSPILKEFSFDSSARIINLGCGNSEFCEKMFDEGYENIVNIDISENVISQMRKRNLHREAMTCKNL